MLTRREFGAGLGATALLWRVQKAVGGPMHPAVYSYVTCGDNQWSVNSLPVDSRATVEAIFEFLSKTFQMKRVYWRGEQDRMWLQHYHFRRENPRYSDFFNWLDYLLNDLKINDVAVAEAHRRGMQIYVYDGLFEHGAQAMTGGNEIYPHCAEDRLRIEHPGWFPVDRWGERISTGPIEFCYAEARQALISRYLHHVTNYGYDGLFFYTYVENLGARYLDEYGFNEPIVKEYKRRHGVDIRTQPFDKEAWYRLRGEHMTQFMRELHAALAARGKKLSMAIYPPTPNYPEPWDGGKVDVPTGGNIYLDWGKWVDEGLVDELFVWWRGDQKKLLDQMLKRCEGKPVELVVAATRPFDDEWKSFITAGVTPASVWAPGFEVDRVRPEPVSTQALNHPDWRYRMEALADMRIGTGVTFFAERKRSGGPAPDGDAAAALARDPHVMVRRQAMFALGAVRSEAHIPVLEAALMDEESSVRIAAAFALSTVNGPQTPKRLMAALLKDDKFQMKWACVDALVAMKDKAQPELIAGVNSPSEAVREVCVRALAQNGLPGSQPALLSLWKRERRESIVFYAITGLTKHALQTKTQNGIAPDVVLALVEALRDSRFAVQLWAVMSLEEVASSLPSDQALNVADALEQLFRQFGDRCKRPDVSWGWRAVGNAMLAYGPRSKERLEAMLTSQSGSGQGQDRWLAWAAYQVLHVPQSPTKAILCQEKDAVEAHAKYAPAFPGWRSEPGSKSVRTGEREIRGGSLV